jgi:hypothetical protein
MEGGIKGIDERRHPRKSESNQNADELVLVTNDLLRHVREFVL